jgi:hypothetical protein
MSGPASPITVSGTCHPDAFDPMLAAIRQAVIDATGGAVDEFTAENVLAVAPDETEQGIDAMIGQAMARAKGLCLLLVSGSAKNPDTSAPGPRLTLALELQLYVSTRIRAKGSRSVLELLAAIMRTLHHAQIRISGFAWYEELRVIGFDPRPDDDFTAYTINAERDFQL